MPQILQSGLNANTNLVTLSQGVDGQNIVPGLVDTKTRSW